MVVDGTARTGNLCRAKALAGVLLAAAGVRMGLGGRVDSVVTRYDVLKPQKRFQVSPAAKHAGERCMYSFTG